MRFTNTFFETMIQWPLKGLFYAFTLTCVSLISSCSNRQALTYSIPKEGFTVVQHIRPTEQGRNKNALYLPPREVKKNEFNTPALNTFVDSMYAVMLRTEGVGIAANQLGKRLQIFMIEAQPSNGRYKILGAVPKQVFINPRITKVSDSRMNFWHGCLSANGEQRGNVATYEWIEYECMSQQGELQKGRLDGFAAVIFQHEFRHMMNGTYLDHAVHFESREELSRKLEAGELPFFDQADDSLPLLIEGYEIGETLVEYHRRKE